MKKCPDQSRIQPGKLGLGLIWCRSDAYRHGIALAQTVQDWFKIERLDQGKIDLAILGFLYAQIATARRGQAINTDN